MIQPVTKANPGIYRSPDGKYYAKLSLEDCEFGELIVFADRQQTRKVLTVHDVNEIEWVPGHPHRLVVATGGADSGWRGVLGLWQGGKRLRLLRRAKYVDGEG